VFQPVSEPSSGKVRIHLDVSVDEIEQALAHVISLGAGPPVNGTTTTTAWSSSWPIRKTTSFCLVQYYARRRHTRDDGQLAQVPFSSRTILTTER
jgi:Glyoxalase-like domain